jgi:hypothetical protein
MATRSTIVAIILVVLIGPVVYVLARAQALHAGFERVSVGDTAPAVRHVMGAPISETKANLFPNAEIEYRYSVWPLPTVWVVGLSGDKVVGKSELQPP